jgi:hypothetical protein
MHTQVTYTWDIHTHITYIYALFTYPKVYMLKKHTPGIHTPFMTIRCVQDIYASMYVQDIMYFVYIGYGAQAHGASVNV